MEKIAICITTRNRCDAFTKCITSHESFKPKGARLFIVDDASDDIYVESEFRFDKRAGIPAAKNKCIELAMDWGADHVFLFDDDTYPVCEDWHLPYINSGIPHLCYTFYDNVCGMLEVKGGSKYKIHSTGNGCMMYMSKSCVEAIGGFDADFGMGKYEHTEYSHRARNTGLIPHPFIDVMRSGDLIFCMDENGDVERSINGIEATKLIMKNSSLFHRKHKDVGFKPYV